MPAFEPNYRKIKLLFLFWTLQTSEMRHFAMKYKYRRMNSKAGIIFYNQHPFAAVRVFLLLIWQREKVEKMNHFLVGCCVY